MGITKLSKVVICHLS